MKKLTKRQLAIRRRRIFLCCCAGVLAVCITVLVLLVNVITNGIKDNENNSSGSSLSSSQTSQKENEEPKIETSATVVNTGDIIVHSTVLSGAQTTDGGYDFSAFFDKSAKYFKQADMAVANLEVTLGGTESGAFSGYPVFNTPDSILDSIKSSGINMLLTANNHCLDTGVFGLKRTAQQLKEKNIDFIGTRESAEEAIYTVKNVNGIKIGMASYTYETSRDSNGTKYINAIPLSSQSQLVNSFSYDYINDFYSEAQNVIKDMRAKGADAVVFYMHWGNEYQLQANTWQKTIAQKLCNMGVDVIVGGHPHVVQPVELIHSEDSQNTTVCIYSMGNAISNQRQELMDSCPSGHTEDGMLFYYTFDKYSDGTTVLSSVDIIPTWVDKYKGGGGYQYTMYPLEDAQFGSSEYGLSGNAATRSAASYKRTVEIIGSGLRECQEYLGCDVRFKADQEAE